MPRRYFSKMLKESHYAPSFFKPKAKLPFKKRLVNLFNRLKRGVGL